METKIENQKGKTQKDEGFTLVEVMVVMVIIGLMTTFVVLNVLPNIGKAKVTTAKGHITNYQNNLELYRLNLGVLPEEEDGLEALVTPPASLADPTLYPPGGFIRKLEADPWGNPYIYVYPGENGEYDIISYGADGEPGGEGLNADVVSWE